MLRCYCCGAIFDTQPGLEAHGCLGATRLERKLKAADEAIEAMRKFLPRVSSDLLKQAPAHLYSQPLFEAKKALEVYEAIRGEK